MNNTNSIQNQHKNYELKQRERLVELLNCVKCNASSCSATENGRCGDLDKLDGCQIEAIADHLLADGWMRPPCDSVWFIVDKNTKYAMAMPRKIDELPLYMLRDLEKYGYYETKEEAEKHL